MAPLLLYGTLFYTQRLMEIKADANQNSAMQVILLRFKYTGEEKNA